MTSVFSAENGSLVKPQTAIHTHGYSRGMVRRRKPVYYEQSKSALQTRFVRRLVAILEKREMSDNQLATKIRPDNPRAIQSNISRITACLQDPGLEMVERITKALGVDVNEMLADDEPKPVSKRTALVRGSIAVSKGRSDKRNKGSTGDI